ncbi:MAG TPA: DUF1707 domain-containing protein [Streptosporangiaceae bacterium]
MPTDDMIRASHADREHTVAVLRDGYTAGRLTLAEFDDRTTAAFASRTWGELRRLTRDLPAGPRPSGGRHPAAGRPGRAGRAAGTACAGTAPVLLLSLFWLALSVAVHAADVLIPAVLLLLIVVWSAARFRPR